MLVVLLFKLNILILLRKGLEIKFRAGAGAPVSPPISTPTYSLNPQISVQLFEYQSKHNI
jgi:hypothetical protein